LVGLTKLPVEVVEEGDYSAWALKWESAALSTVFDRLAHGSEFTPDESKAIVVDINDNLVVVTISDGSLGTERSGWATGLASTQMAAKSLYGKYVAVVESAEQYCRIWKDGVYTDIIEIDVIQDSLYGVIVSYTGRYIIVLMWDDSDSEYTLQCYEGS